MGPDRVFRARVRDRGAYPAVAAFVVMLAVVVGIGLLPVDGDEEWSGLGPSSVRARAPDRSPSSPSAAASDAAADTAQSEVGPITLSVPWGQMRIRLAVPAGWRPVDGGSAIAKDGAAMEVGFHEVTGVTTDACVSTPTLVDVGPTVDDLTKALAGQVGVETSGPTDTFVGGHPAAKVVLFNPGSCPPPEGSARVWADAAGTLFMVLGGGTATVYVVDLDGDRLVVATRHRGASAADLSELDAVLDSIEISPAMPGLPPPFPPAGELAVGEFQSVLLDGAGIGFSVPASGWSSGGLNAARNGGAIVKRVSGTERGRVTFSSPDRIYADPCDHKLGPPVGPSAADLAAALSTIPGVDARRPLDVRVGGFPAKQVVLTVRDDIWCNRDRFFLWSDAREGPRRVSTLPATIVVWIVDLTSDRHVVELAGGTKRVVIEGELLNGAGPDVDQEIGQIIDSIGFAG